MLLAGRRDPRVQRLGTLEPRGPQPAGADIPFLRDLALGLGGAVLELRSQLPVDRHVEEIAQDRETFFGLRREKRLELPLGQEHDLPELPRAIAQNADDRLVDDPGLLLGHDLPTISRGNLLDGQPGGVEQIRLVRRGRLARPALLRPRLLRAAHHDVLALPDLEDELDLRQRLRIGMVGPKRRGLLVGLRRLAEKGERQRAEDRRLARARLAIDAEEPGGHRLPEIDDLLASERPEGLQLQPDRPHAATSEFCRS